MPTFDGVSQLSDDALLAALRKLVGDDARLTAALVAHLAEVDRRRLHAREAYPSLFAYCTGALHLSEQAAYLRIQAARVSRRCPIVLAALARGELTLSAVKLLDQYLTPDNEAELIRSATHRTVRELELLLAERFPRPDVPTRLRKLPEPRLAPTSGAAPAAGALPDVVQPASEQASSECVRAEAAPARSAPHGGGRHAPAPARVVPLAPARYKLELTLAEATRSKLRRAQELLRHSVPSGDIEQILSRALDLLIEKTEKRRFGAAPRRKTSPGSGRRSVRTELGAAVPPAEGPAHEAVANELAAERALTSNERAATVPRSRRSRHLPASVRRTVFERDEGRCAYVSPDGRRCAARDELEFHHRTPHARGGPPTVENVDLRCRTHNLDQAERDFGRARVEEAIGRARSLRRLLRPERVANDPLGACGAHDPPLPHPPPRDG